jgi:hypothetical protein
LKSLYIWEHIDGKPVSRMLVDGGAAVSLMPYTIFKKLGREDDKLVKTNITLNSVGATRWRLGCHFHETHYREQVTCYRVLYR